MTTRIPIAASALLCAALMVGCSREPERAAPPLAPVFFPPSAPSLPYSLLVPNPPADPRGVGAAQLSAREGETIVLRGRIGGTVPPFAKGRAVMTIADTEALQDCSMREGAHCTTPWDYHLEDGERIFANIATIRVSDDSGQVLPVDLEGAGGMKPLSIVVVEGRVRPRPDPEILEIDATSIFVERP